MSNAMRTGKRWLAGVAAGALGAGLMTFVAAPSASANTLTGVNSPVRATLSGTTLDAVPFARIAWTSTVALVPADTAVVTLTTAPSPNAQLAFGQNNKIGTSVVSSSNVITNADDSDTLATTATGGTTIGVSGTSAAIAVAVNTPGTYGGTIRTFDAGIPLDTIAFSFATTGKPASMALTPATQSIAVGGAATLVATISDSSGNVTQPSTVDSVTLTGAGGTLRNAAGTTITSLAADDSTASGLFDGAATFGWLNGGTGGTYAISAAPAGTLGAGGITTQTSTVSVSGSVRDDSVASLVITSPATANLAGTQPNTTVDIPTGSSSVTVAVTGTAAQAGGTVRLQASSNSGATGTPNTTTPAFANVTLDSSSKGTATFALGGTASSNGNALTIQQVTAGGTAITNSRVIATNRNRTVTGADLVTVPGGSIVQTLGTATPVKVEVYDQFGDPVSGATVRAYRTSTSGALLATAVSSATGVAAVTVTPTAGLASGAVESYVFTAQPIGGNESTASSPLTITYTTSGAVTSMSVSVVWPTAGATSPILNTSPTPTLIPAIQVPFNGTATTQAAANSAWNTTTNAVVTGGAVSGNLLQFTALPSPANTVTVTTPEGVFLSDSATSATKNAWNAGTRSLTVNASASVYVFATKTGRHEVTFTSGAITTKVPIQVVTVPAAAYNISVSPTTRTLEAGAFGTVDLRVTDVFDNPVPGTIVGTGDVTASASGEVLLSGLSATANLTTGAAGTATVTLIGGKAGVGKVAFAPTSASTNLALAWRAGYIPPTGAPAPVKSAEVAIVVTDTPDKVITISGTRGTVSGKSGIIIDGVTDGIENGKTVTPFIRFPGETTFTAGSARPAISGDEFTWQRKTGKRVTVYVELSDDASIRSNRVTIQAN